MKKLPGEKYTISEQIDIVHAEKSHPAERILYKAAHRNRGTGRGWFHENGYWIDAEQFCWHARQHVMDVAQRQFQDRRVNKV